MVKNTPHNLTILSNLKKKALILALVPFGVGMLIVGLLFGVGYWTAESPAARYLLLAAGIGGASYIFLHVYRTLRSK